MDAALNGLTALDGRDDEGLPNPSSALDAALWGLLLVWSALDGREEEKVLSDRTPVLTALLGRKMLGSSLEMSE